MDKATKLSETPDPASYRVEVDVVYRVEIFVDVPCQDDAADKAESVVLAAVAERLVVRGDTELNLLDARAFHVEAVDGEPTPAH